MLGSSAAALDRKFGLLNIPSLHSEPSSSSDITTDAADPSPSTGAAMPIASKRKSEKRKAAEALLERKASKQRLDILDSPQASAASQIVAVPACSPSCPCGGAVPSAAPQDVRWCGMPVTMPSVDWPTILRTIATNNPQNNNSNALVTRLPGGITVHLVERHADLVPALTALRNSMEDNVIGLDLEWRPDFRPGQNNHVALIQLASATVAVLIRSCRLGFVLPGALRHFFADPSLTFVSFSWHCADEDKMRSTFGAGRAFFARFVDLQCVAESLGYQSIGLANLTQRVLGVALPKSRSVSRSDWQRSRLTQAQVQYAALDALVTGHVFRGLRLWHASPSPCTSCKDLLGVTAASQDLPGLSLDCRSCGKTCKNFHSLMCHVSSTGHDSGVAKCEACGRFSATTITTTSVQLK